MTRIENVIVGAGPYGLSIASHFRASGIEALVVGRPMSSWRANMPKGMILKSETFASNLADPQRRYTLEQFYRLRGKQYRRVGDPLASADFIDYADWFRQHAAPDVEDVELRSLRRSDDGFRLLFNDGREIAAKRVVLATGHVNFRHMPDLLASLPREVFSHTCDHDDLTKFAGKSVIVIGRGQSGLETAALLHELGADVRLLARKPSVEWNPDPNAAQSLWSRLRWPEAGLGSGWYSLAISELPRPFFRLPLKTRDRIFRTSWGPSGAWWLKERIADKVPVLTASIVSGAAEHKGKAMLAIRQAGHTLNLEADHVIAATGYKVDVARLPFLDQGLRSSVKTYDGSPQLNAAFESTVPGLHFVGLASAQSFGPVMRFVYGTKHASAILTRHIRAPRRHAQSPRDVATRTPALERFGSGGGT